MQHVAISVTPETFEMLKGKLDGGGRRLHRSRHGRQGVDVLQGSRRHPGRADPPAADGGARERPARRLTTSTAGSRLVIPQARPSATPSSTSHSRCASVSHVLEVHVRRDSSSNIEQEPERADDVTARSPRRQHRSGASPKPSAPPGAAEREEPGHQERQAEPERVDGEQRAARPTRDAGSRRCRGSNRGSARCTATSRSRTRRPRPAARRRRKRPSCGWKRFSWYSHGARRNSEPSRNSAIASMQRARDARERALVVAQRLADRRWPSGRAARTPRRIPRRTTRSCRRCGGCARARSSCSSAMSRPVTIDR